jgi:predicted  nucleic acid-binding Zn-ribbon protein
VAGMSTLSKVFERVEKAIRDFERELWEIEREVEKAHEEIKEKTTETLSKYCNIVKKESSDKGLVKLYECIRENKKFYIVTYAGDQGAKRYITNKIEKAEEKYNEFLKRLK